jgi:thiol-disulfide isomerase/thioredoxin
MRLFINKLTAISAIIALIAVFSCNKDVKNNDSVIIANIDGMAGEQAILENLSPLVLQSDTASFDDAGHLTFNLKIKKPSYFSLGVGRTKMILYVRPGDSVVFSASTPNLMASVQFSGNAPIYNDYLIRFNKISANFQGQLMRVFAQQEDVVTHAIDSVRALHADEIANLQKGNSNLDPYFLKIEKARVLYEWAILYKLYPNYYNYIHHSDDFKTSPEYDTYLAEVNLNDGELVDLPLYISFLETYMRDTYDTYFSDSLKNQYSSFISFQLSEIEKQFENQDIKSIMVYNAVKQQINYDGVKDMDTYWAKFKTSCLNEDLVKDINAKLDEWKHLKRGEPAKDFTFVNTKGENVSLSDFKGKWVYIDIWATWCSPCMHEVPYLKSLEEELSVENIVFMSISVDKTQEPWLKTVEEKQMNGVQVWAGQNDIIKDFYKVSGIPRFMIIDPKGNIFSSSADRPSDGVGEKLKELLHNEAS